MRTQYQKKITRTAVNLITALLLSVSLSAQSGTVMPIPRQQFFDANGNPLAGGKLYTYQCGTTTPLTVYQDAALVTPHANPITLDNAGRTTVYLSTSTCHKFRMDNASSVTLWTVDNVFPLFSAGGHLIPSATNTLDLGSTSVRWRDLFLSGDANIGDQLLVAGAGPHVIGGASGVADQSLRIQTTNSGATSTGYGTVNVPTINAGATFDAYGFFNQPTLNEAASGTHVNLFGALFAVPIIGAGAATVTNAATIYIAGAPTAGASNYALLVASGLTHLAGSLTVTGVTTFPSFTISTTGYVEGIEVSEPAAPSANQGRIFFKDNGAGKTQLCVKFATGAVQCFATEP